MYSTKSLFLITFFCVLASLGQIANAQIDPHNLPHDIDNAYLNSEIVFFARIGYVERLGKDGVRIGIDRIELIKGAVNGSFVEISYGEVIVEEKIVPTSKGSQENPWFYLGFEGPGAADFLSWKVTTRVTLGETYLFMLPSYGIHEFSLLAEKQYPALAKRVREGRKVLTPKFSIADLIPYYDRVYEISCEMQTVIRIWSHQQMDTMDRLPAFAEPTKCYDTEKGNKSIYVLVWGPIETRMSTIFGIVFPGSATSNLSELTSSWFWPFEMESRLNEYFGNPRILT